MTLEKRLLVTETAILVIATVAWWVQGTPDGTSFLVCLHRTGVFAVVLGLLMLAGAWSGNRVESIAYLKPPDARRLRDNSAHLARALGDLNVLALCGFFTVALVQILSR